MTIELHGIELHAFHGVLEHERQEGQRFLVDLELDLANATAAETDRIVAIGRPVLVGISRKWTLARVVSGAEARVGPDAAWDRVAAAARGLGARVEGAELVGLIPDTVLDAVDEARWAALDIGADRTIEARLAARA